MSLQESCVDSVRQKPHIYSLHNLICPWQYAQQLLRYGTAGLDLSNMDDCNECPTLKNILIHT